jgi:hypothetical protein
MHWIGMRHDSMRLGYRKEIQLTRRIAQNVAMPADNHEPPGRIRASRGFDFVDGPEVGIGDIMDCNYRLAMADVIGVYQYISCRAAYVRNSKAAIANFASGYAVSLQPPMERARSTDLGLHLRRRSDATLLLDQAGNSVAL